MKEYLTIDDLADAFPEIFPTANAIYVRAARAPESLPPRIVIPGIRKIIFRRQAVIDWLVSHEAQPAPAAELAVVEIAPVPPKRKRGRPTKAEQLAAREADKPC